MEIFAYSEDGFYPNIQKEFSLLFHCFYDMITIRLVLRDVIYVSKDIVSENQYLTNCSIFVTI